jgi:hypothetical protein
MRWHLLQLVQLWPQLLQQMLRCCPLLLPMAHLLQQLWQCCLLLVLLLPQPLQRLQ